MTAPKKPAPAKKAETTAAPAETADVFAFPSVDVAPLFRDFAENSMTQSKEAYAKIKEAAEDTSALLEQTIEKTRDGVVALNSKAIETAKENTDATLSHVKDVFAVKSLSEALELQTAFVKKQMDTMQGQVKEFQDLTTKMTEETSAPYKAAMKKTVESFKVA